MQTHREHRRQTIDLLDRLHGDPDARRELLDTTARWKGKNQSD
jgi:hypothetical protein